ncbi:plasmid pRiA4b ORF-3 family protein [Calidifontibacter sp. DB0510]|uniref:Plasmid pRiA4b ORF-3 family protein n=1 Tax=Metallococcus carri TaxID=1656884 RepID=A0A967B1B4_9MICO|nr:plasmid pRiA4b ORF-3 family protein [Metallococcus carri]NHN56184.1 plasmid pRiA4b ORF-3 family protein [Metallococcus carri]NOP38765.1 plasmid pRiA4b ORF-3 family protein [Calidifontibacter sp. DB2511S]
MSDQPDIRQLAEQFVKDASPEQRQQLLQAVLGGDLSSLLGGFEEEQPRPTLLPTPAQVRGFRLRLELRGTKPAVWRRLEVPGNLTLPQVHDVIQTAMGWLDGHLHRFTQTADPRGAYFLTEFDVEEGDEGVLEDEVRLDQLLAATGDRLWYEYDFGDGWEHVLTVEEVLDAPPPRPVCLAGKRACPPEDCGGVPAYQELAAWARNDYSRDDLPEIFDSVREARDWLPLGWHPDDFDLADVNDALSSIGGQPPAVNAELTELVSKSASHGDRRLRTILAKQESHGPTEVSHAEAARITEGFRVLLDAIGDGVTLTSAGYLPPPVVEQVARESGITSWWIGKANREDLTPPVSAIREAARSVGLISVRKGRLAPTAAAKRCGQDPIALWQHIVSRLPLGTKPVHRQAGWLALAVVGSGAPAEEWDSQISDLMAAVGWRVADNPGVRPPADSETLDLLEQLAGKVREGWQVFGVDEAVAATARAATRRT